MGMIGKNRRMAVLFLLAFRFVRLLLSGHQGVALENAALRMQIAAFQRKRKRPLLTTVDRVFWITLRSLWDNWRPRYASAVKRVTVFKVMTWNVENLFKPGAPSGAPNQDAYDTKIQQLAAAINDQVPDALALQEIGDT